VERVLLGAGEVPRRYGLIRVAPDPLGRERVEEVGDGPLRRRRLLRGGAGGEGDHENEGESLHRLLPKRVSDLAGSGTAFRAGGPPPGRAAEVGGSRPSSSGRAGRAGRPGGAARPAPARAARCGSAVRELQWTRRFLLLPVPAGAMLGATGGTYVRSRTSSGRTRVAPGPPLCGRLRLRFLRFRPVRRSRRTPAARHLAARSGAVPLLPGAG